jgi:hypothetical protein
MMEESIELMEAFIASISEVTIDLTALTDNGTAYVCMLPAAGEVRRMMDLLDLTRPPFDPTTLRDEAHVTLIYSRKAGLDPSKVRPVLGPHIVAWITGVEYWEGHDKDGYAVFKLESPEADAANRMLAAAGAQHSFDKFQAHLSICSKVGPETPEVRAWVRRAGDMLSPPFGGAPMAIRFDRIRAEDIKED